MSRSLGYLDAALAWMAGLAVVTVVGGCLFGGDLISPADEGAGPYVSPERAHGLHVAVGIGAGLCLLLLVRTVWGRTVTPLVAAALVVTALILLWLATTLGPTEFRLGGDGFDAERYETTASSRVAFYNTTGADITVCLGTHGDCDSTAAGPERLRSPGLTVPANHRVALDLPERAGDFRLTLVNPPAGAGRRDVLLHTSQRNNSVP
jgi:hypothetical protein